MRALKVIPLVARSRRPTPSEAESGFYAIYTEPSGAQAFADLKAATWTILGERMKAGATPVVPRSHGDSRRVKFSI